MDRSSDHYELRYGDASESGWDAWIPVALVGRARQGVCNVEFLIDRANPRNAEVIKALLRELNFHLGELREPDMWSYLRYHCGTMSNVCSPIHWGFLPPSPKRRISRA